MGLDTHRVSNKVSKITSRHLVPLDRAFPAHALVHAGDVMRVLVTSSLLWVAIPADAQQPGIDEPVTARGCLSRARRSDCLAGNCGLVLRTNEKRDQAPGAPLSVSSTQFELIGESELLFELEEHSATRWTSRCGWHGRAASTDRGTHGPQGTVSSPTLGPPRTPAEPIRRHLATTRSPELGNVSPPRRARHRLRTCQRAVPEPPRVAFCTPTPSDDRVSVGMAGPDSRSGHVQFSRPSTRAMIERGELPVAGRSPRRSRLRGALAGRSRAQRGARLSYCERF